MFARSTTIHAHPSYIDAGIKYVRDTVVPTLAELHGCLGTSLIVDRDTGRCIATSSWRDEESLRAAEEPVARIRDEAARIFHATTDISRWEVAAMHRDHRTARGACCVVTWVKGDPDRMDYGIDLWKMAALPRMEEFDGFCSAGLMVDRATALGVSTLTFDSTEAMRRNRERIGALRDEMAHAAHVEVLDTGEFELLIAQLHLPEMA